MDKLSHCHALGQFRGKTRLLPITLCAAGLSLTSAETVWGQATPPTQTETPGNPAAAPDKPYVAPATFSDWASSIKFGAQVEGAITVNPQDPRSHRNFPFLTTDDAKRPLLNEAALTVSRDVDPKATSIDVGFKLQAIYGSDARIYQTLSVLDQLIHDRNQIALTEADVSVRFPDLFANGLDLKAGIFPTPLGFETIDPKPDLFYSHSYIFNFGLPFKETGALATAHVSDLLDLYGGISSGNDTFIGYGTGDNNNRPAGIVGFGLNFYGGDLTLLALSHIGPEDSKRNTTFANSAVRYYNDVVLNWKANPKLTVSAEGNFVRDDGVNAEAWGISAYGSYALSDTVTLNGRAEVFPDNNNFFVSTPQGPLDFANAQRGVQSYLFTATKPTTYSEFTAGITYKPTWLPPRLSTAMIRPEIRYDRALNNSRPFSDGADRGFVTLASDIILGF